MFELLSTQTHKQGWLFVLAGALLLIVGIVYGPNVFQNLKSGGMNDPMSSSARESRALESMFPKSRVSLILLASSKTLTVSQPQFRSDFLKLESAVQHDQSQPAVFSYYDTSQKELVSRDGHSTYALVCIPGNQQAAYRRILGSIPKTSLDVQLGGPAAADYEVNAEVQKDLPKLGAISLPLLGILLLFIFRSVIAALLPLLMGAISVLGAFAITRFVSHFVDISVFAANIISLLGLGLSIDYSLLFVRRFRDEIRMGRDTKTAIGITVKTAGESILLSGTTVALSLLGLLVFPQMFLRSMGLGGAIAVVVAILSSLTVLPAMLALLGRKVDLLTLPSIRLHPERDENHQWRALGKFVVGHPGAVLTATLTVLIALGIPFLHSRFTNPGVDSLPASFASRQVADKITRDFSASENPAIEVILTLPVSPTSPLGIVRTDQFEAAISNLPGVRSVDGISLLAAMAPPELASALLRNPPDSQIAALKSHFVSGNATLLDVNYTGGSEDQSTINLVKAIRSLPAPASSTIVVGGQTAELSDQLQSLSYHLPMAIGIIFIATFVVMLTMLSSVVIPLKAILLNTLSLSATFGLMTWIFQDGHLHRVLAFTPNGSLDPTLPVLIFAIAFGLATDYEVFLVSRIKEEYERLGDNSKAIVIGVEKTGGVITSAGLLLVVVVAAFGLSDILSMKEMGVGLAIAVAVDAAIVRTLLVPAAMQMFNRLNWWTPWNHSQMLKIGATARIEEKEINEIAA